MDYPIPTVCYRSTRGGVAGLTFIETVISGLAEDGGLLVPERIPTVSDEEKRNWRELAYRDLCFQVMRKFITELEVPSHALRGIIQNAYHQFRTRECVEISQLYTDSFMDCANPHQESAVTISKLDADGVANHTSSSCASSSLYVMELYHGPTFSFKDFALQFLGQLFDYILTANQLLPLSIVCATSGDTGSAAVSGFQGLSNIKCVILYPEGKTSRIQQLQMTTVKDPNVECLALEGACFDDCQSIVKEILSSPLKTELQLTAVNSINWARILAQIVYYWYASFKVQELEKQKRLTSNGIVSASTEMCSEHYDRELLIDICVPTGNFGNILAAYYAKQMGAPLNQLIIASNSNDILTRCFRSGKYQLKSVIPTSSPSMDIQISSNFERFFYDLVGGNSNIVKNNFGILLKTKNEFELGLSTLGASGFSAYSASEEQAADVIRALYQTSLKQTIIEPVLLDPHTAVGVHCALEYRKETKSTNPLLVVATAHFGKFPETLEKILGPQVIKNRIPIELEELEKKTQKFTTIPVSVEQVRQFLMKFCASPSKHNKS